jgi:hypothetical protein
MVSGIVLVLSISGLLQCFTSAIPLPVVKGIQVGAGLSLILSAGTSLLQPLGWSSPNWADNLSWALLAFISLLFTMPFARFPYALVMFITGIILSTMIAGPDALPSLQLWRPEIHVPSWASFQTGALAAGLGQLPLTTLNSVIAVSFLSADLLTHIPAPSVTSMGISVALMNLVGGWFGAMPVCHGSGGLAAQYRFGARSGASIIILGLLKITLGFFFGESLIGLLRVYPRSLLGILVLAAGLELAKVGESLNQGARDLWVVPEASGDHRPGENRNERHKEQRSLSNEERKQRWNVMLMTIGGMLAFKNAAVGFLAGMMCHWVHQSSMLREGSLGHMKWKPLSQLTQRYRRFQPAVEEEEQLLPEAQSHRVYRSVDTIHTQS